MAVRVTQQKDDVVMTDNVKLISMILLSVSLFFSILFYTSYQVIYNSGTLDAAGNTGRLYVYLTSMSALTIGIIAMEFYHIRHRALAMFKYGVIVANAVMIGFLIHELGNGYDDIFGGAGLATNSTIYTYSGLAVGFAGVGTLLAILHNFHGIAGLV
tara:strand:+ start:159 stop:629 length:471 start_codon:yes stop_codon:yes gene_type:complete